MSAAQVLAQLEKLPFEEQREVFEQLRDRFDDELSPGEAELIDRRLQDHLDHPEDVIPFETLKARLDAKYGK
jgi:putative addiction module component (TIGR02574 family)